MPAAEQRSAVCLPHVHVHSSTTPPHPPAGTRSRRSARACASTPKARCKRSSSNTTASWAPSVPTSPACLMRAAPPCACPMPPAAEARRRRRCSRRRCNPSRYRRSCCNRSRFDRSRCNCSHCRQRHSPRRHPPRSNRRRSRRLLPPRHGQRLPRARAWARVFLRQQRRQEPQSWRRQAVQQSRSAAPRLLRTI